MWSYTPAAMKVLSLTCNSCGAPLEVPPKTRFLTCAFCDARLEVQQTGSAHFTHVLEAVETLRDDVGTIKLQNELARLDREWQMERERYMTTDQHGRTSLPTRAGGIGTIAIGIVGGVMFFLFASRMSVGFGSLGFVFTIVAVLIGVNMIGRAERFEKRRARYRRRRREVVQELRTY